MIFELKRAIKHPQYDLSNNDNDFALVRPTKKFEFSATVDYIDLPGDDDSIRTGTFCWTAGWGNIVAVKRIT